MKVKIKTWGRMVEEFGTDSFGVICCVGGFYDALEKELPKDRVIYVEDNHWQDWLISKDMIECVVDEPAEETGIKHDNGKPPVGLLFESFPRALKEVARVSGHGCKEYGRHNWDKLENGQERYLDAMCRHILDRAIEGDVSDETWLYHIAQAVWNGLSILELYLRSQDNAKM